MSILGRAAKQIFWPRWLIRPPFRPGIAGHAGSFHHGQTGVGKEYAGCFMRSWSSSAMSRRQGTQWIPTSSGRGCDRTHSSAPILESCRLTSAEAEHYLRHTLGIDSVSEKLRVDRFGLLGEIVRQSHYQIPFQTVGNIFALPPGERHIPSFDEIKAAMFSREGGVCYELNVFTNRLLAALGYNVTLIGASFFDHDRYHLTNIVNDRDTNYRPYLIEVGACDPTFQPIPLDFHTESAVYQDSAVTYKYARLPNGHIQRLHKINNKSPDVDLMETETPAAPTEWKVFSEMDPNAARDLDHFDETMSCVFMVKPRPKLKIFGEGIMALILRNGHMVYIRDTVYYVEVMRESRRYVERHVTTSEAELIEVYKKYVPSIPRSKVLAGLRHRKLVFPKERAKIEVHIVADNTNNQEMVF